MYVRFYKAQFVIGAHKLGDCLILFAEWVDESNKNTELNFRLLVQWFRVEFNVNNNNNTTNGLYIILQIIPWKSQSKRCIRKTIMVPSASPLWTKIYNQIVHPKYDVVS